MWQGDSLQDGGLPLGVCCSLGSVRIELNSGHPAGPGDWLLVVHGGKTLHTHTHTHTRELVTEPILGEGLPAPNNPLDDYSPTSLR